MSSIRILDQSDVVVVTTGFEMRLSSHVGVISISSVNADREFMFCIST